MSTSSRFGVLPPRRRAKNALHDAVHRITRSSNANAFENESSPAYNPQGAGKTAGATQPYHAKRSRRSAYKSAQPIRRRRLHARRC
jgi:hypothetical protein